MNKQAPPDPEPSRRGNFLAARNCIELDAEAGAPTSVSEELDEALARRVRMARLGVGPGDRERTVRDLWWHGGGTGPHALTQDVVRYLAFAASA